MNYSPSQYFNDELFSWSRNIEFYKEESRALFQKISVATNDSLMEESKINAFMDQLMMHEQKFDHLKNQIKSQQFRLERAIESPILPVEPSFSKQQDLLRSRLHSAEKSFIRIKYACAFFISSYLNGNSVLKSVSLLQK